MQILIDIRSIIATLAVIAGAALSSCSDSASGPDMPDTPETTAQYILGLYVQTGDNAGSRAPSGDYDPGMGYENYIDVAGQDFKVAIFTADAANTADDGTLICEATDVKVTPQESGIGSKRWLLEFQIPATAHDAIDGKSIKVVMMANWRDNYPELTAGSTKLSELYSKSSAMDYSAGLPGAVLTADDKIAMFGVCQYDNVQLVVNWSTILDERLHLLRALAKIEVWDSPESSAKISSVSLTRYMDKAMPLPAGVTNQNDYVKNDYDKDYGPGPSLPAEYTEVTTPVQLTQASDGHYIIYVPEYQNLIKGTENPREESERMRLELTFNDNETDENGAQKKYYIEFGKYDDDSSQEVSVVKEYFNICRNYWYKYEVSKDIKKMNVIVDVQPYAEIILRPNFGFERDDDGNIIVRDSAGKIIRIVLTSGESLVIKDVEIGDIGEAQGVYDKGNIIMAILSDDEFIIYNYTDANLSKQSSWERYETFKTIIKDEEVGQTYLAEEQVDYVYTYNETKKAWEWTPTDIHTYYDSGGRVLRQYKNKTICLADCETDSSGNTIITYYDEQGKIIAKTKVTPEGVESEEDI